MKSREKSLPHAVSIFPDFTVRSISGTRVEKGKAYYNITWVEEGGAEHICWRRYSEFDKLRKLLLKTGDAEMIKALPFPNKTKLKRQGSKDGVVDERSDLFEGFLTGLVLGKIVLPDTETGKAGCLLWDFLSGEENRAFHTAMSEEGGIGGKMDAMGTLD